MKRTFGIGFVIGILYILVFALIARTGAEGLGMLIDILVQPAGLIVNSLLEYLLKIINLRDLFFNNFLIFWGLLALVQGIFLGLVFMAIRKLFLKTAN